MDADPAGVPFRDFPSDATTPCAARRFVEEALGDVPGIDLDAAVLLTSELVTNAVRHVRGGRVRVEIRAGEGRVWIGVTDGNPGMLPTNSDDRDSGGLGLPIVGRLSDGWGVDQLDRSHKCVWFQMSASRPWRS